MELPASLRERFRQLICLCLTGFLICCTDSSLPAPALEELAPPPAAASGGGATQTVATNSTNTALNVPLAPGVSWTYAYQIRSSSSSASGNSTSTDSGVFTLTLGASTVLQGREAFPIEFSVVFGDDPRFEDGTRLRVYKGWTHFANGNSGELLGSRDGVSLETIYGNDADSWDGLLFFAEYQDPTALTPFATRDDERLATVDGFATSVTEADPFCERLFGNDFCNEDREGYREREFFVPGVGPWSLAFTGAFTTGSGTSSIETNVDLIATTIPLPANATIAPGWQLSPNLPEELSEPLTVTVGDNIFLFGGDEPPRDIFGTPTIVANTDIYRFDTTTNMWSSVGELPREITDVFSANIVNGQIVLFVESEPGILSQNRCAFRAYVIDPSDPTLTGTLMDPPTGRCTEAETGAAYDGSVPNWGSDPGIVVIEKGINQFTPFRPYLYSLVTNSWREFQVNQAASGSSLSQDSACAPIQIGDTLYFSTYRFRNTGLGFDQDFFFQRIDLNTNLFDTYASTQGDFTRCDARAVRIGNDFAVVRGSDSLITPTLSFFVNVAPIAQTPLDGFVTDNPFTPLPDQLIPRDRTGAAAAAGRLFTFGGGQGEQTTDLVNQFSLSSLFPGETIDGTNEADVISGTPGDDIITGFGGPDLIDGGDGNDLIRGDL